MRLAHGKCWLIGYSGWVLRGTTAGTLSTLKKTRPRPIKSMPQWTLRLSSYKSETRTAGSHFHAMSHLTLPSLFGEGRRRGRGQFGREFTK